ncbi:MAG: nucleotide pyrophosphohydrolase [Desulfobacca sp.]|uniref:nucleotide pyrophosphohydrolase n=1 Tax=Desulfobacca sp. TaxID=2067990 RepID=UPI00404A33F2
MAEQDTLADLQRLVTAFRDARAWQPFHTPKNLAMAIAIEAGELQELFLWKNGAEIQADLANPRFHRRLQEEMADVLIFLLSLAEATGVELSGAVRAKIARNQEKYPVAQSYGRHTKYHDLT